jgi:cyclophilin family peptidyl-prolyl cis-trans isomerase
MSRKKAILDTSLGKFTVELFNDKAPVTVGNFLKLVDEGFFNGLIFHRVIPRFMVQTGCPHGTGFGGPGYTIKDEFNRDLKHEEKGILSMANTGRPNTGGSQFFITVAPTPWLNGKHAIFGKVVENYDVVDQISQVKTGRNDKPVNDVVINTIHISD